VLSETQAPAHPPVREAAAQRESSLHLASVYLELTSRVEPTWDHPEPEAYVTDLRGKVLVRGDEQEDACCVGTISAFLVHLQRASDDGMSWADVLDAHSEDMASYLALLNSKGSGYSNWVETTLEPLGRDLLVLDRIRIEPEHRGHGYGLYAAELMMNGFGLSDGIVACQPAPYELLKRFDDLPPLKAATTSRRQLIPEWGAAEAKLRKHWSLLGFRRVPKSDLFALSLAFRRPSIQTVIQQYKAGRQRPSAKHHTG
jgi:GNAT superfamily N-acetyltransferase